MGAAAPHAQIACKALKGKCTAGHSLNTIFIVMWTIVLKTIPIIYMDILLKIPITHSYLNSYFSITII